MTPTRAIALSFCLGLCLWTYINWNEISAGWDAFWGNIKLSEKDKTNIHQIAADIKDLFGIEIGEPN